MTRPTSSYIYPLWCLMLGMACLSSCTNEPEEELLDPIPSIQIVGLSPSNVISFQDSLLLEISYEDMDGDLGSWDPDDLSLYVKDSRLEEADFYFVPPIAPQGEKVWIRGSFSLFLNPPFLLGNGQTETVFFTVKIRDQAGNWSEEQNTPVVTINP